LVFCKTKISYSLINVDCPLCFQKNNKVKYNLTNAKAHLQKGLLGYIKECSHCGLLYKTYKNAIQNLYDDDYASLFLNLNEYSSSTAKLFFKNVLQEASIKNNKASLLDIGCGVGKLLDVAKQNGFTTFGVELSSKLAEIATTKGHEVFNKNINDVTLDKKFDVITLMDLIEHLENPKPILVLLQTHLALNGQIIIYTPNHNSLIVHIAHFLYKLGITSPIENIFACTHTVFFTTKTLQKILIDCNYKVIKIKHFNYDTTRTGQRVHWIAKMIINTIETIGNWLNLKGFRVIMYAQKNSL
jgi:2-polyprenyl-3-methyl-5-hydroxy-6-metoxy-1,4-benzoquinol methylase